MIHMMNHHDITITCLVHLSAILHPFDKPRVKLKAFTCSAANTMQH